MALVAGILSIFLSLFAFAKTDHCEDELAARISSYASVVSREGIEIAMRLSTQTRPGEIWVGSLNYADNFEPLHLELSPGYVKTGSQMTLFGQATLEGERRKIRVRLFTKDPMWPHRAGIYGIQIETPRWLGMATAVTWKVSRAFRPARDFRVPAPIFGAEAREIYDLFREHGVSAEVLNADFSFRLLKIGGQIHFDGIENDVQLAHVLRGLRLMGLRADHPIFKSLSFIEPRDA